MNILIKDGLALLREQDGWKCEKRDILIEGKKISKVAEGIAADAEKVIDASGKLVMPGLINAHTHVYMTAHRNYADDLAFFDWLAKVQKVEEYMSEEDIYWGTLLGIIEMLKSGTTCFVDMNIKSAKELTGPLSAASGAAREAGIRAVISRGLAGEAEDEDSIMKFGEATREMEMFAGEDRISFLYGPHAPYSCMASFLKKMTEACKDRGIGQTIHLSESQAEMEGMAKAHGTTPIKYVADLGVFEVPVIAAHCVNATDEDIKIMAEKNVSVAINPKSNMKLGNGFAPVWKFLEAGVNVCLGTDGCGSNNSLNMFQEMATAALVYKGATKRAQCVSVEEVLDMATVNGAKALGREGELGVIREGALADLIMLDLKEPQFQPANNIASGLVYSAKGSEVETVIVDGEILLEEGRLTTIDEERVYLECSRMTKRLGM